jgi:redox-sensitive bicupin YhaK (pirin superfamily)
MNTSATHRSTGHGSIQWGTPINYIAVNGLKTSCGQTLGFKTNHQKQTFMYFKLSPIITGTPLTIGSGFEALQFTHDRYPSNMMSPVVMIDHFRMETPTFEPHPHAGMSAVTLVLQDTKGAMMCVDSTGHHSKIGPGDLHWTLAGRGIVHTQQPANVDSRIHALQIFINLPTDQKMCPPDSFHVPRSEMPRVQLVKCDVTVVAGTFKSHSSPAPVPQAILILDINFDSNGTMEVPVPLGWNAVVLCINGAISVDTQVVITAGQSLACKPLNAAQALSVAGSAGSHMVLIAGAEINEPLVQSGPFVMQSNAALTDRITAYRRGDFGSLDLEWLEQES